MIGNALKREWQRASVDEQATEGSNGIAVIATRNRNCVMPGCGVIRYLCRPAAPSGAC